MRGLLLAVVTMTTALTTSYASAQQTIAESVAKGCQTELDTYCREVTPGKGRGLACLYAHEDKLSGQCEYALYNAAAQLQHAIVAFEYLAEQCDADLDKYCSEVQAGEGRILNCLKQNQDKLSEGCGQAMQDVGVK